MTAGVDTVRVDSPEQMRALGRRLAGLLRAGDLVLLIGSLGAGKTTLAQGIGEGLGVRGPVSSPTFVIARVHPSLVSGPPLVHVDAYRLGGSAELDDLDLDTTVDRAVTVIEWGEGLAEVLSDDRLELRVSVVPSSRPVDPGQLLEDREARQVSVTSVGARWSGPNRPALERRLG